MFQGNFIYYFLHYAYITYRRITLTPRFCLAHSGSVSVEANPAIPTMELIYCTIGGEKIDAWKYMDIQTTATGTTATGTTGSGMPL